MESRFPSAGVLLALCAAAALTATPNSAAAQAEPADVQVVDADGTVGEFASLTLDAAGNPVIAYFDRTNGDLKLAHCTDPACTTADIQTVDADGTVGEFASLALDTAGNPVIAYFDRTNGDLELAHCTDPACTTADIQTVDSDGTVGEYTSLTLDPAGDPVIAYFDRTNDALKLVRCDDPTCAAVTTPVVLDDDGGTDPSLTLDPVGHPVVSFYGPGRGDIGPGEELLGALMLVHCDDPSCDGDIAQVIDDSGDLGLGSSLVLDAAGEPTIAYYNGTDGGFGGLAVRALGTRFHVDTENWQVRPSMSIALGASGDVVIVYSTEGPQGALFVARCDDPQCRGRVVDPVASELGTSFSMQLDGNDWPVIAYHDRVSGSLRVARCSNGYCAAEAKAVTIDPIAPLAAQPMDISVSGWPETCSQVELGYLDGSAAPEAAGGVLGSWGTVDLVSGAARATVTAPQQSGEYELRVSGSIVACGAPYHSPDFYVGDAPAPGPGGRTVPTWVVDDGVAALCVDADGWPDSCTALDLHVAGPIEIANDSPTTVFMGTMQLAEGGGTLLSPTYLLSAIDGWQDIDRWEVVASGPVDRCDGAFNTELGRIPADAPVSTLPATGTDVAPAAMSVALVLIVLGGALVLVAGRCRAASARRS